MQVEAGEEEAALARNTAQDGLMLAHLQFLLRPLTDRAAQVSAAAGSKALQPWYAASACGSATSECHTLLVSPVLLLIFEHCDYDI